MATYRLRTTAARRYYQPTVKFVKAIFYLVQEAEGQHFQVDGIFRPPLLFPQSDRGVSLSNFWERNFFFFGEVAA